MHKLEVNFTKGIQFAEFSFDRCAFLFSQTTAAYVRGIYVVCGNFYSNLYVMDVLSPCIVDVNSAIHSCMSSDLYPKYEAQNSIATSLVNGKQ